MVTDRGERVTVVDAASTGDRLKALEALRQALAEQIDASESARDVASLAGQMRQVLADIEGIQSKKPASMSAVDEIAARRKARRRPVKDGETREVN